jgi:opacity protein-like surface antigen
LKGGAAWANSTYNLFANTLAENRGTGSTTLDTRGWTIGVGIEYAVTNQWIAVAEYDHIGLPSTIAPFPTVATINTQSISIKQSIDLLKVGVNYKFDFAALGAMPNRRL